MQIVHTQTNVPEQTCAAFSDEAPTCLILHQDTTSVHCEHASASRHVFLHSCMCLNLPLRGFVMEKLGQPSARCHRTFCHQIATSLSEGKNQTAQQAAALVLLISAWFAPLRNRSQVSSPAVAAAIKEVSFPFFKVGDFQQRNQNYLDFSLPYYGGRVVWGKIIVKKKKSVKDASSTTQW